MAGAPGASAPATVRGPVTATAAAGTAQGQGASGPFAHLLGPRAQATPPDSAQADAPAPAAAKPPQEPGRIEDHGAAASPRPDGPDPQPPAAGGAPASPARAGESAGRVSPDPRAPATFTAAMPPPVKVPLPRAPAPAKSAPEPAAAAAGPVVILPMMPFTGDPSGSAADAADGAAASESADVSPERGSSDHAAPTADAAHGAAAQAAWWLAAVGGIGMAPVTPASADAAHDATVGATAAGGRAAGADGVDGAGRGAAGPGQLALLGAAGTGPASADGTAQQGLATAGIGAGLPVPQPATATGEHPLAAVSVAGQDNAAAASMMRAASALAVPGAVDRTIGVAVSDPSWQRAVAAQVQWMAGSGVQSATLRLTPEHLGPLEVRIDLQSSQINVSFVAPHAETRSALEQSVPVLREMLANGGLTLGQANVQSEARSASQFTPPPVSASRGVETAELQSPAVALRSGVGLVDEYA